MPVTTTTATATTTAAVRRGLHPGECGGDGCNARNPWPLHNVRHRGIFCRLCTSCVLRYHHGSFCSICFEVLDGATAVAGGGERSPTDRTVFRCAKCPSICHLACLPPSELVAQFVCPSCKNPDGFSYFPVSMREETAREGERPSDGSRRTIDSSNAKVLLAAAQLAAASMRRAAAAARSEAERKVKEAALARKRARDMLEAATMVFRKEKEKEAEAEPEKEEMEPNEKMSQPSSTVTPVLATPKMVQNREKEKLRKFHEPIPADQRPAQGTAGNDKSGGTSVAGSKDVEENVKDHVEHEEKKGPLFGTERGNSKEEKRNLIKDADKGTRGAQ